MKMYNYRVKNSNVMNGIFFTFIVFNNVFQRIVPFMSYLDELILLWAIIYLISKGIKNRRCLRVVICVFLIIFIGLFSNVCFGYQSSYIGVIKDLYAFLKFPIVAIACFLYAGRRYDFRRNAIATILSKIYLTILTLFGLVNLVIDIGMSADVRHGIRSFKFLFGHPTFLVLSVVIMISVIVAHGLKRTDYIFVVEAIFLLIISMRDKGFGFAALLFIILFLVPNAKKIKNYIPLAVLVAFFISKDKIKEYASWSWSPRFELYRSGLKILKDCFPIGTGFATFSSYISGEYYAKTYYIYGFFGRNAPVNPDNYADLGDAGLPYFAQFGIIGIIILVVMYITLFKICKKWFEGNSWNYKACILLLGYAAIASLVENVFTNESGALIPLIIFIYLTDKKNENKDIGYNV